MDSDLKEDILENKFIDRLRSELTVDKGEYTKLLASLKLLAQKWHGKDYVDKELMADLYVLAPICHNMASEISGQRDEIDEMATEIDALVLDCLAITYTDNDLPQLAKRFDVTED